MHQPAEPLGARTDLAMEETQQASGAFDRGEPAPALVHQLYSALNRWDGFTDPLEFAELLAPTFARHEARLSVGEFGPEFRAVTRGLFNFLHMLVALKEAMPNLHLTLESVGALGEGPAEDRVTLRGAHFQRGQDSTTCRNLQIPMRHLWRAEDGRLAECWAIENGLESIPPASQAVPLEPGSSLVSSTNPLPVESELGVYWLDSNH